MATGLGAFIAVAAYVLNAVADMAGVTWLAWLSPYYWAFGHAPITTGFDIPGLMLLLGLLVTMVAVAGWRFDRRDVGT